MSDDYLMDRLDLLKSSDRNPENKDQDEKDIKEIENELKKRGFES